MAKVLVTEASLEAIGDALRAKLEVETTYLPGEMAAAIRSISTGIEASIQGTTLVLTGDVSVSGTTLDMGGGA